MNLHRILAGAAAILTAATLQAAPAPPPATLDQAAEAYARLDLDEARAILGRIKKDETGEGARLKERILLATNMMERVENVEILDSATVAADDFFNAVRLAPATGRLTDSGALVKPLQGQPARGVSEPVFVTEDGSTILWTGYDEDADEQLNTIYESVRLADGSWAAPRPLFTRASIFEDGETGTVASPFLMADGVTYYFAADGPQSLGGLDIFVVRRDGDGFLQPANVGMPYNSPANDYMMAIDEVTGLGWFVTDRNAPEDCVTVYVFVPSELRVNFPAETEGLADVAMLKTLEPYTREGEASHASLLDDLDDLTAPVAQHERPDFEFAMPDGRILTDYKQLRSNDAMDLMAQRVSLLRQRDELASLLSDMRADYGRGDRSQTDRILASERRLDEMDTQLRKLSNDIVECEKYASGHN